MRIYLDSCVIIYAVESVAIQGPLVVEKLEKYRGQAVICVSDMARLECNVGPLRKRDSGLLAEYANFFSATENLDVPSPAFDLASNLRAQHGLKTPDALHLAAAIHHGCDEMWTNDDRLSKAAAGSIAVRKFN